MITRAGKERIAVAAYFGVLGLICTAWASSIDDLKVMLGLTPSQQGWLLFSGPVGNLISFSFASSLLVRLGARRGLRLAGIAYLLSAFGLASCFWLCPSVPYWCVAIACLGGTGNIYNIAVNTQGGVVERKLGRHIMNSFHAVFSLMCLVSGGFAFLSAATGIAVATRFFIILACAVVIHLAFFHQLPADEVRASAPARSWHRPDRTLIVLGLAALIIMGCEGAVSDWVGVFYREALGVPATRVKIGFCAVTGLMTIGRFLTDGLIDRFTARRVFHAYSLFVSLGLALALIAPYLSLTGSMLLIVATTGFAITGLGISGLVPILYSKANRTQVMPASSAITFVGSMGFLGFFMGPPLIGQLAEWTSYSVALGIFAVLILACLFLNPDRD